MSSCSSLTGAAYTTRETTRSTFGRVSSVSLQLAAVRTSSRSDVVQSYFVLPARDIIQPDDGIQKDLFFLRFSARKELRILIGNMTRFS